MQHPPYRELFDFRPTAGPSPLLLVLGKISLERMRQSVLRIRSTERPSHAFIVTVDISGDGT